MASEVVVTSAPRGVKLGRTGFQVVMRTAGMREDVTGTLEQLGDYRHVHPQGSGRNPTIYTFRRVRSFVGELSALVRSVDAGNDFSGRSNKLTHVVALGEAEVNALARATPPALLRALESDGTLVSAWPGGPEERPSGPRLPSIASEARRCDRWAEQTGDAGWAGVIAERALRGAATLVVAPDCSPASSRMVLDLFDEVYALLPRSRRWEIPFDTTLVAAGSPATLRGTYAGSPESATPGTALVVELAGRPPIPPEFETSDLVATARTGAARSGPATGRASSGPRPPGPLPVPGGPPLGHSLGHPESSDPYGFDNLLNSPQTGPPRIPGGPPPPPVPTGAIGHGGRTRGGDEDARPQGRNPVVIPVAIVLTLLVMLALGIGVYAGIKLRERKNAIKNLSEIAKAEPPAADNAGEDAPKPKNTLDDLVRKALWPNTDWWYFLDPVVLNSDNSDKVSRFVGLLKEIKWGSTDKPHELLSLWRDWDRIGTWGFKSIADLQAVVKSTPLLTQLKIPEQIDPKTMGKKPPWKDDIKLLTLAAVNQHLQTLKLVEPPQKQSPAPESGQEAMAASSGAAPVPAPQPPPGVGGQPITTTAAKERIIAYARAKTVEPTREDWRRFPPPPVSSPSFGLTIEDLTTLLNSALTSRRQNGWRRGETQPYLKDEDLIAIIQNEPVHSLLNVLFKADEGTGRIIVAKRENGDFVKHLSHLGIDAKAVDREPFQKNINTALDQFVSGFDDGADGNGKSNRVDAEVVRRFIRTLDVEKLKELLKPSKPIAQSVSSATGPVMPERQPTDNGPSNVEVGMPTGHLALRDLLLDGRAEITFPVKHNSDAEKAIEARMDTNAIHIIKHLGFDYSFPDKEGEPNTVIALTGAGIRGNKKPGNHCLEDFDKAVDKAEIMAFFLRLQQSESKSFNWLDPELGRRTIKLSAFFPQDDDCGRLGSYIPFSTNPSYKTMLKAGAEENNPFPPSPAGKDADDATMLARFAVEKESVLKSRDEWVEAEMKKFTRVKHFWFDNYCSAEPKRREKDAAVKESRHKGPEDEFRKWTQTIVLLDWIRTNINMPLVDIVFPNPSLPGGPK